MEKDFDFKQVGKRVPYTVLDNFFEKLEDNVWKEVRQTSASRPKRNLFRLRIMTGIAIAASIALLLVLNQATDRSTTADSLAPVEQAFSNLSSEDRAYMLQVYQEDIFINE